MIKKTLLKLMLVVVISVLFGGVVVGMPASAQAGVDCENGIKIQVPLVGGNNKNCVNDAADYILRIYKIAVGSIGVIATVMIMIGGFQWIFAAGNASTIDSAKTTIISAIAGLLIAISSFTILNTINPNLTSLKIIALPQVKKESLVKWCPNVQTFQCGNYYEYKGGTWSTKGIAGGGDVQKAKIRALDAACRGQYCSFSGKQVYKKPQQIGGYVGGCYPTDLTKTDVGDQYSCMAIQCPGVNARMRNKKCDYYNVNNNGGSELRVSLVQSSMSGWPIQKKEAIANACLTDICEVSGGTGCKIEYDDLCTVLVSFRMGLERINEGGYLWYYSKSSEELYKKFTKQWKICKPRCVQK